MPSIGPLELAIDFVVLLLVLGPSDSRKPSADSATEMRGFRDALTSKIDGEDKDAETIPATKAKTESCTPQPQRSRRRHRSPPPRRHSARRRARREYAPRPTKFREAAIGLGAAALVARARRDIGDHYLFLAEVTQRTSEADIENGADPEFGGGIDSDLADLVRSAAENLVSIISGIGGRVGDRSGAR
jgi:Sec-independent protein translocase protein TatA